MDFHGNQSLAVNLVEYDLVVFPLMAESDRNKDVQLIVNADDYGYFRSVSQGILDAARNGAVTATGIMANSQCLDDMLPLLAAAPQLDAGVHLNLTYGEPLSPGMTQAVAGWGGNFPGKYKMALAVLSGKIRLKVIEQEFTAQIERCLDGVNTLQFLNSHEHIHMLPAVYKLTLSLAKRFGIPFVRHTTAEWTGTSGVGAVMRNTIFQVLGTIGVSAEEPCYISCIGIGHSGKLDPDYLRKLFARMQPGNTYELMCHPGYYDPAEIDDRRLIAYHAWDAEHALLASSGFRELCSEFGIRPARYRDLSGK